MVITIHYGDEKLTLRLPDHITFDEYNRTSAYSAVNSGEFREAVSSAEGSLFPIFDADLFVFNDAYRPTPSAKILNWIDELGKLNEDARFLIATGCHQPPSEQQLKRIFGDAYGHLKDRIIVHNAQNDNCMVKIGKDYFGEPVLINRDFYEARRIVVISSVEPHYFAGFTGGRKSVFPGLCDYNTTVRNHNLAVSFSATPMKLEGNPVEEHLQSLMKLIPDKKIFSIQLVVGKDSDIQAVFCGALEGSFNQARELSARISEFKIGERYDLLLAEVRPPLDSNLYQLQKSLENCQSAVADGGTMILFSPCSEGIGVDSFYRLAEKWNPNNNDLPEGAGDFGMHKLYRVSKIGHRISINLYSELPKGVPDRVFFKTMREPQSLINKLAEEKQHLRIALVHDAGHTVLVNY